VTHDALGDLFASAGVEFRMDGTNRARLQLVDGSEPPTRVTATLADRTLRFVAHDVIAAAFDADLLWRIDALNQEWPFGPVFFDGGYAAAAAAYVPDDGLEPAHVHALLRHLRHLARSIGAADLRVDVPAGPSGALELLATAMRALGHRFTPTRGGAAIAAHVYPDAGERFLLAFFESQERFLIMRARLPPERTVDRTLETLERLQAVNAALSAGAVSVWEEPNWPYYHLSLPLAWTEIDAAVAAWLLDRAAAAGETIVSALVSQAA
jgi:hypothetical protein